MGIFIRKHKWYNKKKVVVFENKLCIYREINYSLGQSVFLKINLNGPIN